MGSGGGGGGGNPELMYGNSTPMPGLPVAGSAGSVNPQEYGKFQSFLPDIKAEGVNDMATGLRPDMFRYRSPNGVMAEGSGGGAGGDQELRDMLAQLLAGGGGGGNGMTWMPNSASSGSPTDGPSVSSLQGGSWQPTGGGGGTIGTMGMGGGGGTVGTMGMGGGGGGGYGSDANGNRPPPGALQLPDPAGGWSRGNAPGWPRGGPGTALARPGDNPDPQAAAAALAALQASGG